MVTGWPLEFTRLEKSPVRNAGGGTLDQFQRFRRPVITTISQVFPQYCPSHARCGSLTLAPAGTNMGRMTNRFLDSYGLLLNRKLRNEPNEQGAFARKLRNEPKKLGASVVGQAVSPANRKLRNEPKKPGASVVGQAVFACQQKITKRTQGHQSCGLRNLRNCSNQRVRGGSIVAESAVNEVEKRPRPAVIDPRDP
jgi:hypothetical protein